MFTSAFSESLIEKAVRNLDEGQLQKKSDRFTVNFLVALECAVVNIRTANVQIAIALCWGFLSYRHWRASLRDWRSQAFSIPGEGASNGTIITGRTPHRAYSRPLWAL